MTTKINTFLCIHPSRHRLSFRTFISKIRKKAFPAIFRIKHNPTQQEQQKKLFPRMFRIEQLTSTQHDKLFPLFLLFQSLSLRHDPLVLILDVSFEFIISDELFWSVNPCTKKNISLQNSQIKRTIKTVHYGISTLFVWVRRAFQLYQSVKASRTD